MRLTLEELRKLMDAYVICWGRDKTWQKLDRTAKAKERKVSE